MDTKRVHAGETTMKKLTGLDDKLPSDDAKKNDMPTIRATIRTMMNTAVPANNEESIEINQVLLKLRQVEPDIELENAEFAIIMRKFNDNAAKMFAQFHGPTVAYLKEIEKASEGK
jgi:hypothetical protein